jgi:hypothetical protein
MAGASNPNSFHRQTLSSLSQPQKGCTKASSALSFRRNVIITARSRLFMGYC